MRLSPSEFKGKYDQGELKIAFIGMSNIGKSYTAKRLADAYDFDLIEIDKCIQDKLGHNSMDEFARWQGQPYEPGYAKREAQSIALESEITRDAIKSASGNLILDTPGSIIYTDADILKALTDDFLIVHIKAVDSDIERLKADYHARPKPLVWAGHYRSIDGLSEQDSIFECYPALLEARAKKYAALADVTLGSDFIIDKKTQITQIFEALSQSI